MHGSSQVTNGIVALVGAAVIVFRTLRPQTMRVWALVVVPLVLLVFAAVTVAATPPASMFAAVIIAGGALCGVGLGYARGIHSRVVLGPRPGTLTVSGNALLVAILLGALGVRLFARAQIGTSGPLTLAFSDAVLVFAVLSVGVARAMLFLRWRRLTATGSAVPRLP